MPGGRRTTALPRSALKKKGAKGAGAKGAGAKGAQAAATGSGEAPRTLRFEGLEQGSG